VHFIEKCGAAIKPGSKSSRSNEENDILFRIERSRFLSQETPEREKIIV
jgi:hypothetical protein